MKKLLLILVFIISSSLLYAKSDIQITSPFVSFFNNFEVSSEGPDYEKSSFFNMSNSAIKIMNYNYVFFDRFGFYESFSLVNTTIKSSNPNDSSSGLQISFGPAFMIFDNSLIYMNVSVGPDIQIFSNGVVLGVETDFQVKFTANRRCSPVIGTTVDFDFYSSQKAVDYLDKIKTIKYSSNYTYTEHYKEPVEYAIRKYLYFYVRPYIAFCVNLY